MDLLGEDLSGLQVKQWLIYCLTPGNKGVKFTSTCIYSYAIFQVKPNQIILANQRIQLSNQTWREVRERLQACHGWFYSSSWQTDLV